MTVKVTKAEINQRELATRVELQDRYIGTDELSAKKVDALNQLELPAGTTVQRPNIPGAGSTRWNTETQALEVYSGTEWLQVVSDYAPNGSLSIG